MTKEAPESPTRPDESDQNDTTLAVHEAPNVKSRLLERTCGWCGIPVPYTGKGRPPRYCRTSHRKRASELRRAQALADRPVSKGGKDQQPVREIIENTRTVVRTVVQQGPPEIHRVPATRLSGQPYTIPEDAIEWAQMLAYLRREAELGRIPAPARESLARACETIARALRPAVDVEDAGAAARTACRHHCDGMCTRCEKARSEVEQRRQ